jgi:hypothetical protein
LMPAIIARVAPNRVLQIGSCAPPRGAVANIANSARCFAPRILTGASPVTRTTQVPNSDISMRAVTVPKLPIF